MSKPRFRIGDKVVVIGMPPRVLAPGVRDELGTKKLFKRMVGRVYTVQGFDQYEHIELHPTRSDRVWIEPEFLKLRASTKHPRKRSRHAWSK